jgi:hypothetical protein
LQRARNTLNTSALIEVALSAKFEEQDNDSIKMSKLRRGKENGPHGSQAFHLILYKSHMKVISTYSMDNSKKQLDTITQFVGWTPMRK